MTQVAELLEDKEPDAAAWPQDDEIAPVATRAETVEWLQVRRDALAQKASEIEWERAAQARRYTDIYYVRATGDLREAESALTALHNRVADANAEYQPVADALWAALAAQEVNQ